VRETWTSAHKPVAETFLAERVALTQQTAGNLVGANSRIFRLACEIQVTINTIHEHPVCEIEGLRCLALASIIGRKREACEPKALLSFGAAFNTVSNLEGIEATVLIGFLVGDEMNPASKTIADLKSISMIARIQIQITLSHTFLDLTSA
jgi:hypothetical protein